MFEELKPEDKPQTRAHLQAETGLLFPELAESPSHDTVSPAPVQLASDALALEDPVSQPAEPEPEPEPEPSWKAALRRDFEHWLAGLEDDPEIDEAQEDVEETPDLYSFYEQLAASNVEGRKANRRTAEAISQWGDTLSQFDAALAPLRESITALLASQPKAGQMSRAHCLVLIELVDRLRRIARAFESAPQKRGWWGGDDSAWRQTWEAQRQAFGIVLGHVEEFLKQQGVTRLEALGRIFDPSTMSAVAVELDPVRPNQIVVEELASGYERQGELLRPAQVKVSRKS